MNDQKRPGDTLTRRIMSNLARRGRKRHWHYSEHDQHLRGRLVRLLDMRYPWYDWGHRALVLFGDCEGGNYWQYPVNVRRTIMQRDGLPDICVEWVLS